MANDDTPCLPVQCPKCGGANHVRITHPAHRPLNCCGCDEPFEADQVLIRQFYAADDSAHCVLEDFYRAPLVQYFLNHGVPLVQAEELQIDVFNKVWETKHPQPGNNPQRYDPDHPSGASFRTWLFRIAARCLLDRKRPALLFSEYQAGDIAGVGEPVDPTAIKKGVGSNPDPPRPEDEASAREHRAAVHDCRDQLPPREKLAINEWLNHDGERGVGYLVAEALKEHFPEKGTSAATASMLLNKAQDLMRKCLEAKGVTANWSA
jgi:hypothetical protein